MMKRVCIYLFLALSAMAVCTFLESRDLKGKIIVPFFTYGATTCLQQSVDKIYQVTPQSVHLRTYPGRGERGELAAGNTHDRIREPKYGYGE